MMENEDLKSIISDMFSTLMVPVIIGVLFIFWAVYFFQNPTIVFPVVSILVLILYFLSGSLFGGVLTALAVLVGIFSTVFIGNLQEVFMVLIECLLLVIFYVVLELYRSDYQSTKNLLLEEYETLDRDATIKESEIAENKRKVEAISQKVKNFQKIGGVIETFQESLDEKDIIEKSSNLALHFAGSGSWKLKKHSNGDVFSTYVKNTGLPLFITDIRKDRRFFFSKNKFLSVIAVPVEVNGFYWGIIRGVSSKQNVFENVDLRLLSILSSIISNVLNNAYLYQKNQELAITDGLTGLFTQSYFKERFRGESKRAKSNKSSVSVGILDIDFFKNVNDTFGHQAGDIVLRQLALLLRKNLRRTDIIARYGGEEFAVMMLHTDENEAFNVLEKLRTAIEEERFLLPLESSSANIKITVSIGFASTDKNTPGIEDDLIKRADSALYKVKNTGRNKTCRFSDD